MHNQLETLLCWVGLHKWAQSRPVTCYDMFPAPFDRTYKSPTRHCLRCPKTQHWLPSYGGSEIGCWCPGDGNWEAKATPAQGALCVVGILSVQALMNWADAASNANLRFLLIGLVLAGIVILWVRRVRRG